MSGSCVTLWKCWVWFLCFLLLVYFLSSFVFIVSLTVASVPCFFLWLCCLLYRCSFPSSLTLLILWICHVGIERLLLLLGEKPSSGSPSEGAACERVQQKAAVTLARLSREPDVAQTAIQLKGSAEFQLSYKTLFFKLKSTVDKWNKLRETMWKKCWKTSGKKKRCTQRHRIIIY